MILQRLKSKVESRNFERFITSIIILNAITLGLETSQNLSASFITTLVLLDKIFLSIFTAELTLKMLIYRRQFFSDPWRVFDFIIVSISLVPSSGPFSVIRSLRVLRTLRMLSMVPSLKKVVSGLLIAIPGLGAVGAIMILIFYVSSVMATKLFSTQFPDWFGDILKSAYSLFQIMTLESWSMGIVRPVLDEYPYAWLFFVPFIIIATFTMLNLFIAVIVNAMQSETDESAEVRAVQGHDERIKIFEQLEDIQKQLKEINEKVK